MEINDQIEIDTNTETIKQKASSILRWLVDGCINYRASLNETPPQFPLPAPK